MVSIAGAELQIAERLATEEGAETEDPLATTMTTATEVALIKGALVAEEVFLKGVRFLREAEAISVEEEEATLVVEREAGMEQLEHTEVPRWMRNRTVRAEVDLFRGAEVDSEDAEVIAEIEAAWETNGRIKSHGKVAIVIMAIANGEIMAKATSGTASLKIQATTANQMNRMDILRGKRTGSRTTRGIKKTGIRAKLNRTTVHSTINMNSTTKAYQKKITRHRRLRFLNLLSGSCRT